MSLDGYLMRRKLKKYVRANLSYRKLYQHYKISSTSEKIH